MSAREALVVAFLGAIVALAIPGCSGRGGGATVDLGAEMHLEGANRIRVDVANPERASGWQTLGYVFDAGALKAVRNGLTADLPLRTRLRCPEQYRFFVGTDEWGSLIGYLCADGTRILRGSDAFWEGKDVVAPAGVAAALDAAIAQVKEHPMTTANPSAASRLAQANRLEIRRIVASGTYPLVATVTDAAVLGRLASALDSDRPLVPGDGCEPQFSLTFLLGTPTGATSSAPPPGPIFRYRCADRRDLLSGAQIYWVGDSIEAPQGFRDEFDRIVAGRP